MAAPGLGWVRPRGPACEAGGRLRLRAVAASAPGGSGFGSGQLQLGCGSAPAPLGQCRGWRRLGGRGRAVAARGQASGGRPSRQRRCRRGCCGWRGAAGSSTWRDAASPTVREPELPTGPCCSAPRPRCRRGTAGEPPGPRGAAGSASGRGGSGSRGAPSARHRLTFVCFWHVSIGFLLPLQNCLCSTVDCSVTVGVCVLCIYVCVYMYLCIYVCFYVCTQVYLCIYASIYIHLSLYMASPKAEGLELDDH